MATIGDLNYGITDVVNSLGPDGNMKKVIQILAKSVPVIEDSYMTPTNKPFTNETLVSTSLPTSSIRTAYQGVAASRGTEKPVVDTVMRFEQACQIDEMLYDGINNSVAFRESKWRPHLLQLGHDWENYWWNGDDTAIANPGAEIKGMYQRYDTLGDQVISCGGSATNTSIWFVVHGPSMIETYFPQGSMGGIEHKIRGGNADGMARLTDSSNRSFYGTEDSFIGRVGVGNPDHRYAVRIANINIAHLTGVTSTQALTAYDTNIFYQLSEAMHRLPSDWTSGNAKIYASRSAFTGLDRMAAAMTNANAIKTENVGGRVVTSWRGVEIKICDTLGYAEPTVTT